MKKNDEQFEKLNGLIDTALDIVYEKDKHLITNYPLEYDEEAKECHVGERAIVFRYAHYLLNLIDQDPDGTFIKYDLDCEYNRNGTQAKTLPAFPDGTFPDLIIHKRGNNDNNLLVIEFKTYWNRNQKKDIRKLHQFTDPGGNYAFLYGMAISFEKKRDEVKKIVIVRGEKI